MKVTLAVLAFLLGSHFCAGQDRNLKIKDKQCAEQWCMTTPFLYKFCDSQGNVVNKCSPDPNNEPGLKLIKRKLPVEFEYQYWTGAYDTVSIFIGEPIDFYKRDVFVDKQIPALAAQAAQRWSALCPPQGPDSIYEGCKVVIRWSYSASDMGLSLDKPALTRFNVWQDRCQTDCGSAEIVINQAEEFTNNDAYDRPRRFIGTVRANYQYLNPEEYQYLDAYTMLLHELGHWLGFGHADEPGKDGRTCGSPGSIMRSGWAGGELGELTAADECMFRKAYCCEQSQTVVWFNDPHVPPQDGPPEDHTKTLISSGSNHLAIGFTVVPNPATSGIIMLSLLSAGGTGAKSIRIVDAAGNTVSDQQLEGENTREVSLDVRALPNGLYIVQLIQGTQTYTRSFVINE